jgi:hypothetical protein
VAQTCGNIVAHLLFSTKLRQPLISPHIRSDLSRTSAAGLDCSFKNKTQGSRPLGCILAPLRGWETN